MKKLFILILFFFGFNTSVLSECYTERCNPYSKYQNPYGKYQNPYGDEPPCSIYNFAPLMIPINTGVEVTGLTLLYDISNSIVIEEGSTHTSREEFL